MAVSPSSRASLKVLQASSTSPTREPRRKEQKVQLSALAKVLLGWWLSPLAVLWDLWAAQFRVPLVHLARSWALLRRNRRIMYWVTVLPSRMEAMSRLLRRRRNWTMMMLGWLLMTISSSNHQMACMKSSKGQSQIMTRLK